MTIARDPHSGIPTGPIRWSVIAAGAGENAPAIAQLQLLNLDLEPGEVDALRGLLDASELARAARFHFERHRVRFIVGRGRLRQMLGAELSLDARAVRFSYGAHDKPFLSPEHASDVHFNLSHSAHLGLIGVSRGRQIGVDVEQIRLLTNEAGLAQDCFSDGELRAYHSARREQRTTAFFNAWTRKEAFIKAMGEGLSYPLKSFDVSLLPQDAVRIIHVGGVPGDRCGWSLAGWNPAPEFAAAVVLTGTEQLQLIPAPQIFG